MKKILGIVLALCMVLGLAACGGQKYSSVSEYINSDEIQKQISETVAEVSAAGIDFEMLAEGDNKLVFQYTLQTQVDGAALAPSLEEQLNAQASTFEDAVKEMKNQIKVDNPVLVLRYVNADGTEIVSKEFTAQ